MFRVWGSSVFRPTMDIDMLGKTPNEEANIMAQIRDIMTTKVKPDGLVFDSNTIKTERITEDADYKGISIKFTGFLGTARVSMKIDPLRGENQAISSLCEFLVTNGYKYTT